MPTPLLDALTQLPAWTWAALLASLVFAAVAHGAVGFGFPLISTPLVALFTDVRTAVVTTLLPNIVLNVISIVRGADWSGTVRRFWPLAAYVLLGTAVGSMVLVHADVRLLKLMLAGIILVYLLYGRVPADAERGRWRHRRLAECIFGLAGGFFSGTVNVAVPPLLIYFSLLDLGPIALTQALNLCFLVGRTTQVAALAGGGHMGAGTVALSVPLSVVCVASLAAGFRLQRRIHPEVFRRLLRLVLWAMAALLAGQAALGFLR